MLMVEASIFDMNCAAPPMNDHQPFAVRAVRALARDKAGLLGDVFTFHRLVDQRGLVSSDPGLEFERDHFDHLAAFAGQGRLDRECSQQEGIEQKLPGVICSSVRQNLPLTFFHSARGGMAWMVSQCSAILPLSTLKRS